jgi:hypothetical protein
MGGSSIRTLRRLASPALAALSVLQLFVARVPTARAAMSTTSPPILYLSPGCVTSGTQPSVTVTGRNFDRNTDIHVYDEYSPSNEGVTVMSTDYGTFTATVPLDPDPSMGHNIWADALVSGGASTFAYYEACRPGIGVSPNCAAGAVPIAVSGDGWEPSVPANIVIEMLDSSAGLITSKTIGPAASFNTTLNPSSLTTGVYQVRATQSYVGDTVVPSFTYTDTVTFRVPCPTISITPSCDTTGSPADPLLNITVTVANFVNDPSLFPFQYPYMEIVFDPDGRPQEFLTDGAADGDYVITPYRRPAGAYKVVVKQGYDRYQNSRAGTNRVWEQASALFTTPCYVPTPSPSPTPTPSPTPNGFNPTITLGTPCGAPQLVNDVPISYPLGVSGSGFVPGLVTITFDADRSRQVFAAGADANGTVNAVIVVAVGPEGEYRVVAHQDVVGALVADAEATFVVPCAPPSPVLSSDITCGVAAVGVPAAYLVNLTGTGFLPGRVDIIFDDLGALPEPTVAIADASGAFAASLTPTGRAPGSYEISAHQQVSGSGTVVEGRVTFTVACEGPQFRLLPDSGSPGLVVTVVGQGFPPNADLLLRWSRGINAGNPISARTDAGGSFTRQVLIFYGDFLGLRTLTIELAADPLTLLALPPTAYRVTQGTVSPPFTLEQNPFAAPGATIVVRH